MTNLEEALAPTVRELEIPAKMGVARIVNPKDGKYYAQLICRLARLADTQERVIQSKDRLLLVMFTAWALSSIAWALR